MTCQEKILIYTDGGCKGNPGPGGWAYLILLPHKQIRGFSAESNTTNNRMELTAVIRSLERCHELNLFDHEIEVVTDSQYVKNGISLWIHNWKKNGWKTAGKEPVKNQDLWLALDQYASTQKIEWKWTKGHAGNPYNEECDRLVGEAISNLNS